MNKQKLLAFFFFLIQAFLNFNQLQYSPNATDMRIKIGQRKYY